MNKISADIVICGAGPSGLAAALSAARQGMNVVLVEEDAIIGGTVTDYFIQNYCGSPMHGIHAEIVDEMKKIDPYYGKFVCFRASSYVMAWTRLMAGLPIKILCNNTIKKVYTEKQNEKEVITAVESDTHLITGKVFIDCTGNADIAYQTSCKTRYGREAASEYNEEFAPAKADNIVQMCTQMFVLKRIQPGSDDFKPNWATFNEDEFLMWGPTFKCEDTTDRDQLAEIQQLAIEKLTNEVDAKWKEKGFMITQIAPKIGVRESRRIVGKYVMSERDLMTPKRYKDSVTVASYPVDPWDPEGNPLHKKELKEKCHTPMYEIPYSSLVTEEVGNMIVAGRCISGTHVAASSYRVMAIAEVTGQIAGIAAAVSVSSNTAVADVDVDKVKEIAKSYGVITDLETYHSRQQ